VVPSSGYLTFCGFLGDAGQWCFDSGYAAVCAACVGADEGVDLEAGASQTMPLDLSDSPALGTAASSHSQQRWLLCLGLGGLLVLLATLGASSVSFLRKIEGRHESIRVDFVSRMRVLEQLRNDVYRLGTRVHDFMLEDDPAKAALAREDVLASRQRIEALEDEYARSLRPEERDLFASLRHEVEVSFDAVVPVLDWTAAERQQRVDPFVRDELHPRRSVMLRIADEIEALNGQDMDRNSADTKLLFLSYRRLLLALVALTLGIGLSLTIFSLWRITGLEAESESRFRQVEHAKVELHALSIKLVDTQETERRKLSRELHDEIGQGLWAVVLGLGNAAAAVEHQRLEEARDQLNGTRDIANHMVRTVRNMALLLRPSILDDLGLIPAVRWLAREITRTSELRVDVSATDVQDDLPEECRTCVYRVVQEALLNARRHAGATTVQVRIQQQDRTLHLVVADDGVGFEPSQERGLGVLGMEERVTHLGGSFRMLSSPTTGTVVDVSLPIRQTPTPASLPNASQRPDATGDPGERHTATAQRSYARSTSGTRYAGDFQSSTD
jgi:signal transduction histidine kinase